MSDLRVLKRKITREVEVECMDFPIIERVKPRGVLGFEFVWTLGLSDFASLVGPRAWKEEWPNGAAEWNWKPYKQLV